MAIKEFFIIESTLREGEQFAAANFSTAQKLDIAQALAYSVGCVHWLLLSHRRSAASMFSTTQKQAASPMLIPQGWEKGAMRPVEVALRASKPAMLATHKTSAPPTRTVLK